MQSPNKQSPKRRRRLIYLLVGCLVFLFVVAPALFATGILIFVYQGTARPAQVITPNVIGQEYHQGEALLKSKGLNMQVRATRSDRNQPSGIIVDQTPRAGESIPPNYTVSVVLSGRRSGE